MLILGVVMKNRIVLRRSIRYANVHQPSMTGVPACEWFDGWELFLRHPEFLRIAALAAARRDLDIVATNQK
jgi:hypothetical protein